MNGTTSAAHCGVCSSNQLAHKYWARDRNWKTSEEIFEIVMCQACGVYQTVPLPPFEQLGRYYPEDYYSHDEPSENYYRKHIEAPQRDKIAKISRFRASGDLLDIGCGAGYFVNEAVKHGYEAQGLEFRDAAAVVGRKRWNLKITTGDFLALPLPESAFDIITLWQVFEHFYNPAQVLRKIHSLLRPQCLLVLAVPNISSIQAKIFGERWYHLEVPRHAFHYSPNSLARLLSSQGFSTQSIDYTSREHNGAGILCSVFRFMPSSESFLHKVLRKTIGYYLANGLARIEESFDLGGTFTIFSVKR